MTSEEFVEGFFQQKQDLLREYSSVNSQSEVSVLINSMRLDKTQSEILREVLDSVLKDTYYSVLLGLDGSGTIGDLEQQQFTILAEDKTEVCGEERMGEVESLAYEYFQEKH